MPGPVEKEEMKATGQQPASSPVSTGFRLLCHAYPLQTNMFGLSLPFSLPALLSTTSPLFDAELKADSESGSECPEEHDLYDQDERQQERALTPPSRGFERQQQPEGPHIIPEFDFESPTARRQASEDEDPMDEAFKLVEDALPKLSLEAISGDKHDVKSRLSGLFGGARTAEGSRHHRVPAAVSTSLTSRRAFLHALARPSPKRVSRTTRGEAKYDQSRQRTASSGRRRRLPIPEAKPALPKD